jgi:glutaminyl-tRNA synthetase
MEAVNNPEDESAGKRKVPFSREIYIERADFMEDPPKKFFRLAPGQEVRLRYAYYITCTDVIKNNAGEIVELHCNYDQESKGGYTPDGRRVKGTIHWVSAEHALDAEVRQYDYLLTVADPSTEKEKKDFIEYINKDSLDVLSNCKVEPYLGEQEVGFQCQFERKGYYILDADSDMANGKLVFNETVGLRDTWGKMQAKGSGN